jgi:hypothetical protein
MQEGEYLRRPQRPSAAEIVYWANSAQPAQSQPMKIE